MLALIASNPSGNLNNAALAEKLSISERHISRLFKERTGTSPARWIERVRVDHSRHLLERDDLPMAGVAAACGFASVDTMRQAFKRIMGLSPSQYRLNHGDKERSS